MGVEKQEPIAYVSRLSVVCLVRNVRYFGSREGCCTLEIVWIVSGLEFAAGVFLNSTLRTIGCRKRNYWSEEGLVLALYTRMQVFVTGRDVPRLVSHGLVLITVAAYKVTAGHDGEYRCDSWAYRVTYQDDASLKETYECGGSEVTDLPLVFLPLLLNLSLTKLVSRAFGRTVRLMRHSVAASVVGNGVTDLPLAFIPLLLDLSPTKPESRAI